MNCTLRSLNVANYFQKSPFITLQTKLTLSNSRFFRFSGPLLISPLTLEISTCSATKFLSQVIKQSFLSTNSANISCASFKDISTESKGSVFSYNNTDVSVDRCSFTNIVSTSYPSCFYIKDANVQVTRCTFTRCHASGKEAKYGNTYYCRNCSNIVKFSYTESCAPDKEDTGDSAISLMFSTFISVTNLNATNSHGNDGAASVTYRASKGDITISFLTVTNPDEHNAIEIASTKVSYLSFANIINSSQCRVDMIHNDQTESFFVSNSVFINPHSTIAYREAVYFTDCYSNDIKICESCTLCSNETRIEINNIFYKNPVCGTCYIELSYRSVLLKMLNISFLILCF